MFENFLHFLSLLYFQYLKYRFPLQYQPYVFFFHSIPTFSFHLCIEEFHIHSLILEHTLNPPKMDGQTYASLERRIQALSVDVSDSGESNLVKEVAQLQAKLNKLYQQNPELGVLDQIRKGLPLPKRLKASENTLSDEEKQEIILLKHPQIKQAYHSLMELLSIELPEILSDTAENLNTRKLASREQRLMELSENFHMMVVKNLVVLEKFIAMAESEMRFWEETEKKLKQFGVRVGAKERQWKMESKY